MLSRRWIVPLVLVSLLLVLLGLWSSLIESSSSYTVTHNDHLYVKWDQKREEWITKAGEIKSHLKNYKDGAIQRSSRINNLRSSIKKVTEDTQLDEKPKKIQYLFFRPRCCSGINNQIEEFWYAAHLALKIGRGLVLPMVAENVTWDDPDMSRLSPFSLFYDANVASQLLPTITTFEWKSMCNSTFEVDIFPMRRQEIVQKKYEQYLNITYKGVPRLVVTSYKELIGRELPDCLGVQWPLYLLDGTLRTEVYPGDPPYGGLVERNKAFEKLRRHTIAAPHIMEAVKPITHKLGHYLAIHVRVGDFRTWCKTSGTSKLKCPTYKEMALQTASVTAKYNFTKVFVACAPHSMPETLKYLKMYNKNLTFFTFHSDEPPFKGHPDVGGMAEMQICIDADVFIGNAHSTWTRTVHQLRFTSKRPCTTTILWNRDQPWCVDRHPPPNATYKIP